MTRDTYQETLLHLYILARVLAVLPLGEMVQAQERADSVGPLVDPTLWMQKQDAFKDDMAVTRIFCTTQQELLKVLPKLKELVPDDQEGNARSRPAR